MQKKTSPKKRSSVALLASEAQAQQQASPSVARKQSFLVDLEDADEPTENDESLRQALHAVAEDIDEEPDSQASPYEEARFQSSPTSHSYSLHRGRADSNAPSSVSDGYERIDRASSPAPKTTVSIDSYYEVMRSV